MVQIGQTLDDAAGEAFDKVAKLLNLGYPGGVVIDRLAQGVDHSAIKLPRPLINDGSYNFSFSGLKTAVLNAVIENEIFPELELRFAGIPVAKQVNPGKEPVIAQIAAAFQAAAVDVIVTKLIRACEDLGLKQIVVAGGVACNSALRAELKRRGGERGIEALIPHPRYCTDNAAMIGVASLRHFKAGNFAPLSLNAVSRWADLA
ncbi:MAG: tRNA N6-adenosine threonylcarbamoyltransferase [Deltaproteobacteria bacterium ADurb.Bin510]|nr:MAG: tRNA N6-adenosine threonylcarbamoyltransferase [Deltaproteobacteria bacterium ADurb.Bin510]